jgi:integrase
LKWLETRMFGAVVNEVDHEALEGLRKHGLADGWSYSSIDRMMGTVSAVLRYCVATGILDKAPMVPMYRPAQKEPKALSPDELNRLCDELPMHLVLATRFAVNTLLRMRAMLRIEWSRVDLRGKRAWIPGAHQKAGRTFGIALSSESVRILRALRMISGPQSRYVFTWLGKPIDDCNTKAFQDAVKRAGLDPFRWHDLRHTFASWMAQSGASDRVLQQAGGWSSAKMVERYAHLRPSDMLPHLLAVSSKLDTGAKEEQS